MSETKTTSNLNNSSNVKQNTIHQIKSANSLSSSTSPTEVPVCLKKLVRTVIRSFYAREHSLIMDLLVRNTIMKEDDLCERLRFDKKQLRQYLHTLKTDQFIKSKLQLETDTDGKTAKITHYFIDYKVFVNVVKYRLDQMQRRLEAEQRQTTSRALFRCLSCNSSYTDLEVDRLFDCTLGKLVCVYCRADVKEEEDNAQRSDARALVAKFHQQVRDPLDSMLKECDRVHLSSSILEPEIRALEPLPGAPELGVPSAQDKLDARWANESKQQALLKPVESTVTIVLGNRSDANAPLQKERPVWMAESTINACLNAGLGELDRGGGSALKTLPETNGNELITQTLAPGRVPNAVHSAPDQTDNSTSSNHSANSSSVISGDIMQLLLVHERRGLGSHGPKTITNKNSFSSTNKPSSSINPGSLNNKNSSSLPGSQNENQNSHLKEDSSLDSSNSEYRVCINGKSIPYAEITPEMIKVMTPGEKKNYINAGRKMYTETVFD